MSGILEAGSRLVEINSASFLHADTRYANGVHVLRLVQYAHSLQLVNVPFVYVQLTSRPRFMADILAPPSTSSRALLPVHLSLARSSCPRQVRVVQYQV
jgi:hypothetical protein